MLQWPLLSLHWAPADHTLNQTWPQCRTPSLAARSNVCSILFLLLLISLLFISLSSIRGLDIILFSPSFLTWFQFLFLLTLFLAVFPFSSYQALIFTVSYSHDPAPITHTELLTTSQLSSCFHWTAHQIQNTVLCSTGCLHVYIQTINTDGVKDMSSSQNDSM